MGRHGFRRRFRGGPAFAYRNGEYELAGIISTVYFSGGHDVVGITDFGDNTAIVNIAEDASQLPILEQAEAAPEPSSAILALFGLFQCLIVHRLGRASENLIIQPDNSARAKEGHCL